MSDSPIGFANLRASLRATETGFTAEISDAWRQGRTAYGGVTTGLAIASARRVMPDLPPLRSMLVNFTGPVVENPVFVPVCLRQGKSVTTVQVTVESAGKVAAQIIFTFGGNRDSSLVADDPHHTFQVDYGVDVSEDVRLSFQFLTGYGDTLLAGLQANYRCQRLCGQSRRRCRGSSDAHQETLARASSNHLFGGLDVA